MGSKLWKSLDGVDHSTISRISLRWSGPGEQAGLVNHRHSCCEARIRKLYELVAKLLCGTMVPVSRQGQHRICNTECRHHPSCVPRNGFPIARVEGLAGARPMLWCGRNL